MVRQPTASRFLSTLSLRRATDEAYFTRKAKPYFYPRSPCGERLIRYRIKARYTNFYPRSPCGERRYLINTYHRIFGISIHALLAESDAVTRVASTPTTVISIHALLAESDQQDKHHPHHGRISIHALLAESDPAEQHANSQQEKFLSTLSLRRATGQGANTRQKQQISIHALLAESDSKSAQNSGALLRIWNKFYGDCIFMLTGKAVFYPFCPCFFHIFWCEGTENFMIAFPSH